MHHLHGAITLKAVRGAPMYQNSNPLQLTGRHFISKIDQSEECHRYRCFWLTAMGIREDTIYQCRKCDVAFCCQECDATFCIFSCFELYHINKEDFSKVPTKLILLCIVAGRN